MQAYEFRWKKLTFNYYEEEKASGIFIYIWKTIIDFSNISGRMFGKSVLHVNYTSSWYRYKYPYVLIHSRAAKFAEYWRCISSLPEVQKPLAGVHSVEQVFRYML
jgi:hypothetical protein